MADSFVTTTQLFKATRNAVKSVITPDRIRNAIQANRDEIARLKNSTDSNDIRFVKRCRDRIGNYERMLAKFEN